MKVKSPIKPLINYIHNNNKNHQNDKPQLEKIKLQILVLVDLRGILRKLVSQKPVMPAKTNATATK